MSFKGFAGGLLANNILQANEKIGILVMSAASPTLEHNLVELNQGHGIVFDECAAGVCTANVLRRNEGEPLLVLGSACPVMQVGVTCVTTDLLCPSHACVRVCVYVCVCVCVCVCASYTYTGTLLLCPCRTRTEQQDCQVRLPHEYELALLMGGHRRLGRNSILRFLLVPGTKMEPPYTMYAMHMPLVINNHLATHR